jgi:hypothetical protein
MSTKYYKYIIYYRFANRFGIYEPKVLLSASNNHKNNYRRSDDIHFEINSINFQVTQTYVYTSLVSFYLYLCI